MIFSFKFGGVRDFIMPRTSTKLGEEADAHRIYEAFHEPIGLGEMAPRIRKPT